MKNKIKSIIYTLLNRMGYRLVKIDDSVDVIPVSISSIIKGKTMLTILAQQNVIELTNHIIVNRIKGDFVECGVWKGGSVALMAYTLYKAKDIRNLHLFDAFDDICEPDANVDGARAIREVGGKEFATGELKPVDGIYNSKGGHGNEAEVLELIKDKVGYPSDNINLYKGWFQNTLPQNADKIKSVAMLRLDGDWYASTKVCLSHLYDKVEIGGVVIIDDYYTYEGCSKAVNEFWENRGIKPFTIKVSADCLFWIKTDK